MKLKSTIIVSVISVSALIIIAFTALTRIEYVPADAVSFSNRYLSLLMEGNATAAYKLTEKNEGTGRTIDAFRDKIRRECTRHGVVQGKKIVFSYVFPRQTYGNRLRRYLHGRNPDMETISIDYHVGGVPLEIRLSSHGNGKYAVIYFQSHAE